MAKKSKAADLSIEEKLEQALVVPGYEPYKIPDNWCWTNFKNVAEVVTGGTPSKKHKEYYGNVFPFFKPADLNTGRNVSIASEYLSEEGKKVSRVIPAKSTLVCCIGSIGKSGFLEIEGSTNQQINSAIPKIEPLYLYYYVNTDCFINQLWSKSSATTISIVNKTKMEECYFPLAPLPEQHRIVERIESLFSKLDETKEKAQKVIDSFETRKAAILHKAFSGELTAKWREENGVSIESWEEKQIKEISIPRAGYAFDSKKFSDSGYQIIRMGNLYNGILDLERNPVFIESEHINDSILTRSLIHSGDILITLTGTKYKRDYGYAVRIDEPSNLLVNQRILCLSPDTNCIVSDYLLYYLQSNQFRDVFFSCETGGVNQGNVSSKFVESIMIPIPQYSEQEEIGNMISNLISKIQFAKESAETVIDQIDIMKKAILARAFRGELGTNDPEEESAVELLKQILSGE